MATRRQRAVDVQQPFHLPEPTWSLITALQDEWSVMTHPDIPLRDYTVDVVTDERPITFLRPDPRCPPGKQRRVRAVLQYYFTVRIRGKLKKDPGVACSYVVDFMLDSGVTRARFKAGSYEEGDCE